MMRGLLYLVGLFFFLVGSASGAYKLYTGDNLFWGIESGLITVPCAIVGWSLILLAEFSKRER